MASIIGMHGGPDDRAPSSTQNPGAKTADEDRNPISPVYWVHDHRRTFSNLSTESLRDGGITLQDNTDGDDGAYEERASWAKSVRIEEFVVINGNRAGIPVGAFVVWNIKVETLHISKRYSEFNDLRIRLLQTFPNSEGAMPPLPPKSLISKFRPKFLENRRIGLQYFLNCILLNPEFSGSPVLKEFLFS